VKPFAEFALSYGISPSRLETCQSGTSIQNQVQTGDHRRRHEVQVAEPGDADVVRRSPADHGQAAPRHRRRRRREAKVCLRLLRQQASQFDASD